MFLKFINTIIKYFWYTTIIIFSVAALTVDSHIKLVGPIIFYVPLPMLFLGLFISTPSSKKIRITLITLSSIGLVIGIGFTLLAVNSGGAQAGVGIFIAWGTIGGVYVASLIFIFVGQAVLKQYSVITHNKSFKS